MKKINYFVGILPEHENQFWEFVYNLNEDTDASYHVLINGACNADYYTFNVIGTSWESYKCFLNNKTFVKSLEHFEED